ncbi:MAG: hypothetical protein JGK17_17075 [Microcoleus sp. PH2017_10_PVI_O_A]|uniref:hypothetical protein n=1 Tax=unclassified Microcoleus TaxID=2642155 RepID=UPI001E164B30|nr:MULTISPECIES: hypothetical protein [unclassified Microcoleus]MCC3407273.1 hypothetical protein [Microcoleus sp. PH2017_10_PVI_O_A]MCC3461349.1 hypothetical protein [Microcoleus sp. PH2017_11_PCY_U_A]MCC3479804.1 hypothetical protein [Microcoleus sp. PH2017_12_PCY_D_A]MCC3530526.1 hypothetical protein [Microcoleus sp. PH2017_21_RUC_O_A]MCC3542848.1 hypothetical protein [Microcoleus sp. PH2017_22_RUC_O_B]
MPDANSPYSISNYLTRVDRLFQFETVPDGRSRFSPDKHSNKHNPYLNFSPWLCRSRSLACYCCNAQ